MGFSDMVISLAGSYPAYQLARAQTGVMVHGF